MWISMSGGTNIPRKTLWKWKLWTYIWIFLGSVIMTWGAPTLATRNKLLLITHSLAGKYWVIMNNYLILYIIIGITLCCMALILTALWALKLNIADMWWRSDILSFWLYLSQNRAYNIRFAFAEKKRKTSINDTDIESPKLHGLPRKHYLFLGHFHFWTVLIWGSLYDWGCHPSLSWVQFRSLP